MAILSDEYFMLGNLIFSKQKEKYYILDEKATHEVKLAICNNDITYLSPENELYLRERSILVESHDDNNPICIVSDMNECRLFIQLTNQCNLRCKHCFVDSDMNQVDYLTYERIIDIINEAVALGINRVDFTGGEVLTKPYFLRVLKYLDKQPISYNFFSNLTLANNEIIDELAGLKGLSSVITSIDYLDAEKHDSFRGGINSYKHSMNAIMKLKEKNVRVIVNTMVMDDNREELSKMVEFFTKYNIEVHFDTIIDCGRAKCNESHNLDAEKNIKCIQRAIDKMTEKGIIVNHKAGSCGVADTLIFLHYTGKYMICPGLTSDISNRYLLGTSMREAWIKSKELGLKCINTECAKYEECSQGCRMRALVDTGSDMGKDSMMCRMLGLFE